MHGGGCAPLGECLLLDFNPLMLERRHGGLWASGLERVRARGWIGIATVVEDAGLNVLGGGGIVFGAPKQWQAVSGRRSAA
jgi:hypothetical protein